MRDPQKRRVLINDRCTIHDAMRIIDEGTLGIALIVDEGDRLQGTVTDGDIRRAILKGVALSEPVAGVMNRRPVTIAQGADMQEVRQLMLRHDVKQIPVLAPDRRVLDICMMSTLLQFPLSNPDITYREVEAVLAVLGTPNLSLGPKLFEFEEKFAAFAGTEHAIAVNSGTSGLHLCVKSLGIGEGDEVITTPFSFIASANAALFERAKPVFVDIDPRTLNLDVGQVEDRITARTRAILPVHVFGHPCDLRPLREIAARRGLAIIEDACEAIGAEYEGKRVGTFGECAVFSFYPNKQMTTAEGGVIVTDNPDVAVLCRSYRNQGRGERGGWLSHERIGYNYRLSELQCALGVVQLDRIGELLDKRSAIAEAYNRRLGRIPSVRTPYVAANVKMSWFVYVIQIHSDHGGMRERDEIMARLRGHGVSCGNYFPPIHLQPFYRDQFGYREGSFPVAEAVSQRTIALPFFNNLQSRDIESICRAVEASVGEVIACGR